LNFFIKVGVVICAIDFQEFAVVGLRGMVVAWVETTLLIIGMYYFGTRVLKIKSNETMLTVVAFSVCGSSAAVAVADIVDLKKEFAMIVITIMSILTIPWIPILPLVGNYSGFEDDVTAAWIGGSVDSTGAVIAAASLSGIHVVHTAVIIKMMQNISIGPIALVLSKIWTTADGNSKKKSQLGLLWEKFPKFVLGFLIIALFTSLLPADLKSSVVVNAFFVSEWFSKISFVLIGLEIDIRNNPFFTHKELTMLYCIGQTMDVATTLGVSYIFFSVIN